MRILENSLSKLTDIASNSFKSSMKKLAVSALAFSTLTFGTTASAAEISDITTIYYVYMDKEYIGTVSDKNVIESVVNEKLTETQDSFKGLKVDLASDLTYIPEQVLGTSPKTGDIEVIQKIENDLSVETEATALVLDGKPVAYLKDAESVNKVIEAMKLKFVKKSQLKALEARKANVNTNTSKSKKKSSHIIDVRFSKEVSSIGEKVSPEKILETEETIKLLTKGTLEEKKYHVKEGDVLGKIANDHNMSIEELLSINPGLKEDSLLKIDQEINVTFLKPLVQVVVEKEVLRKEKMEYKKEIIEDSSMPKGETKVKQKGKKGLREVTYSITEKNGEKVKEEEVHEEVLKKPVKHIIIKGTKVIPSRGDGSFAWPTVGGYVSSHLGYRWGKMHKGIDIARPGNLTIKAADNGVVVSAGWDGGYGNKIVIDHNNGFRTVYAHLSSISVNVGQTVEKGSQIGVMGSTGDSTGTHLHFEIYKNGSLKNPMNYLR
ncbi:M23 family metallopeptidase [Bacillus sp. 31A1R]|uniref:M23 family metallopeptidase n=1 Tax=Robertmurraya mangrovi TaxID=3098077 RepID=A0ABU5IX09_9BACI|nr:M23 family metallopeptidase [Bacillus sp. 31A1R]MDZ5471675.1 M23 family metallopeptidase [Bacillus sp. 31A1R]